MSFLPLTRMALVVCTVGWAFFTPVAVAVDGGDGDTQWFLMLPQEGVVVYRGVASFDEAGTGTASFLYPAPSIGGLLAAVFTHGYLVDSAKKDQKEKLQSTANEVLSPYRPVLDNFKYRDLMQRAVKKIATGAQAKLIEDVGDSSHEMVVESASVFSLTQDQKAIILDIDINIHKPGAEPDIVYKNTARVVSAARSEDKPVEFWMANDGENLKDESAQLVGESLDIAFRYLAIGADAESAPYRTVRYREGGSEKIERAQVLIEKCDRLLIRTLRGKFMSVPISPPAVSANLADKCAPVIASQN